MHNKPIAPDFDQFAKWTASKFGPRAGNPDRYEELLRAARSARDEMARAVEESSPRHIEVLQLLAAASTDDAARPPELTTARGFRVSLAYDDGESPDQSSICVLVQSPLDLVAYVQNETAYLWNGSERFELGQFDADGKAIGTLPAGVQITLSDFAKGKVKLEAPPSLDEE